MNPLQHCAPGIERLNPYLPGKPVSELQRELGIDQVIKLASNENPLGAGSAARAAMASVIDELARYPDGGAYALRDALARHHGVEAAQITIGNGSNDVLDMVARVFLYPGRESLFSQYGFAVYPISSQAVGSNLIVAPAKDYGHDLNAMEAAITDRTGVIWIANPNNPTGTWLPSAPLREFIAAVPEHVVVVIDEAYFEYVSKPDYPDASQWLDDFPNLIVTRTFSKAHGLAALRVGYGLSSVAIADLLNRVRQPFNVTLPGQVAALAALGDDAHLKNSVAVNDAGLAQLRQGCEALDLDYIPSVGNFLTVDLKRPAAEVDQALLREGIIVRPVANYALPNHLRISVGLADENDRCLHALAKVLRR